MRRVRFDPFGDTYENIDVMKSLTRRNIVSALLASTALSAAMGPLSAQTQPQGQSQNAARNKPAAPRTMFAYDDVVRRARELSETPYDATIPPLPAELAALDFDAWREIRFRGDKDPLGDPRQRFHLQAFHAGHLFQRAVQLNLVRDRYSEPYAYSAESFDYGKTRFQKPLPADLGYAGFRVHYPLGSATTSDELISFLGATYFRFLGRNQQYGLSARGLAIGTGNLDNNEEFPFFKEFWIERPDPKTDMISIHALLDSPSVAGAYRFDIYPSAETSVDVTVTLYPRRRMTRVGMAPLTSMFFLGENDRHLNDRNKYDEFRAELHDSDGLLMRTVDQEWVWRPLKNPLVQEVQRFDARNIRGFGLMQRDRRYEHYQDIELAYEDRPSYWIEPKEDWGSGVVELVELATKDETADNVVVAFVPDSPLEPGKPFTFSYRIRSMNDGLDLHKLGYVGNTFAAPAFALGSNEQQSANTRRFMVDFTGGDMDYYLKNPSLLKVVASARNATVFRTFLVPNPKGKGFRAMIDVRFEENQVGTVRAYLQAGQKPVTETWTYAWRIYNF